MVATECKMKVCFSLKTHYCNMFFCEFCRDKKKSNLWPEIEESCSRRSQNGRGTQVGFFLFKQLVVKKCGSVWFFVCFCVVHLWELLWNGRCWAWVFIVIPLEKNPRYFSHYLSLPYNHMQTVLIGHPITLFFLFFFNCLMMLHVLKE